MIPAKKIHGEPKEHSSKEQEYLDGWKRARADLENVKKRMADQAVHQNTSLKRKIAEDFIGLADNFRSLAEHAPQEKTPWIEGVLHVARQFDQILSEFGVETIGVVGEVFDPKIHEAVEEVQSKQESGTIVEIVQGGYTIGEITIRPAKVKTAI